MQCSVSRSLINYALAFGSVCEINTQYNTKFNSRASILKDFRNFTPVLLMFMDRISQKVEIT